MPGLFADTPPLAVKSTGAGATPAPDKTASTTPAAPPPASTTTAPAKPPFDPKAGAKKLQAMLTTPEQGDGDAPKDAPKAEGETTTSKTETPEVKKKTETEKPVRVVKKKEQVETPPPVPKAKDLKKPTDTTAPATTTEAKGDDDFEKGLIEEERLLLDDARDAEKLLGEKYKGYGSKMRKFLEDAGKKEKEFGDDETAYEKWYEENRPRLSAVDFRKLERERIAAEVRKDYEPKLAEERHARWVEQESPKIEAQGQQIRSELWNQILPDDVLKDAEARLKDVTDEGKRRETIETLRKDYAMEMQIAGEIADAVRDDIQEFLRLTVVNPTTGKTIKAIHPNAEVFNAERGEWVPNLQAPDPVARQHAGILAMVNDVCETFKATGGAALKKDGKWFATRQEWAAMAPEQRGPFWTFKDPEIIARAQSAAKGVVAAKIKQQRDYLESQGWRRQIAASGSVPATTSTPAAAGAPPAPRPSPQTSSSAAAPTPAQAQARALAGKLLSNPDDGI